ncbi:hypothetical protein [Endozoicomonas sp. 8E]|uniref:hypothetical protein n=1 Tax=Endozoicomonas sp. 8E TaxID=3035692 RepID=UPI002938D690|nr:hypothetical protein [Endozoicomonas sp. 8E]WOG27703.1 hypothetical protein P6910_24670 [Endozoicomonas sp. 8E]
MDFYQLKGLTQQLHELKMVQPNGFSTEAEDGSIQYLGRQVKRQDGTTAQSEKTARKRPTNTTDDPLLPGKLRKIMPETEVLPIKNEQLMSEGFFIATGSRPPSERQVNLETQPFDSRAEAIQMAARNLVSQFQFEAIEKSPTTEVQCAVFLECLKLDVEKTLIRLNKTTSLNGAQKLLVMLAAEEEKKQQNKRPLLECYWILARIPLSIGFEKAKNLFQRLPDMPSLPEVDNVINEQLTALSPDKMFRDRLLEVRQTLKSENNELSRQLLGEVENIEKKFISRVGWNGRLSDADDYIDSQIYARRLLYLYAACSGFSQQADIAELMSYIRSVLYIIEPNNEVPDSIWHIAKELAYLSKQPGSIDYCHYISTLAHCLKTPAPVALQFKELKQLSDIRGFALLESKPLDQYLTVLRANIDKIAPEYSRVLLDAVDDLEKECAGISLPEGKPDIKAKVHRLLMIIAACKSSKEIMATSVLEHFVRAIMEHGNKKNIPYLIAGLARLVQSTPKIQKILGEPGIKGGEHLRMVPLQWLAFVPDVLSEDDIEELCKSLQASSGSRRKMKDGKVFHQWLSTLEQVLASEVMNKSMVMLVLKKLTQSLTYEKLGWLYMVFSMGDRFNQFLDIMGFSCQKEGLPLLIAEKGADALVGVNKGFSQWLMKQRHHHLLPFYMASMIEEGNAAVINLTHQFIETSVNNTFIQSRQSPLHNPHLQAIYEKYPRFEAGWGANFSGFSEETRNKLLSSGETLRLTENPWDLFISGLEVKSCLSPDGMQCHRSGLMSYVMDGRNAMIVIKNQKGNILSRSVIRMVLDQEDRPALLLEKGYPDQSNLLFIDAARDIAGEMGLPLYHYVDAKTGKKGMIKLLEGRAPFDYFDAFPLLKERQKLTITDVQRDVR